MSLYIKDRETAALADEVARRTGKTKTAVVREALTAFRHQLPAEEPPQPNFVERWLEYRRQNPLPPPTGLKSDKAFFDRLWGEED